MLIGQQKVDVDNWKAHTDYRGEYNEDHITVRRCE
jgi:hypothetical protein